MRRGARDRERERQREKTSDRDGVDSCSSSPLLPAPYTEIYLGQGDARKRLRTCPSDVYIYLHARTLYSCGIFEAHDPFDTQASQPDYVGLLSVDDGEMDFSQVLFSFGFARVDRCGDRL